MKSRPTKWLVGWILTLGIAVSPSLVGEGISGTGIVWGFIDRFGSVVIDGVHYDTSQAIIRTNGIPGTEFDLKVGQQVVMRTDAVTQRVLELDQYDTVAGTVTQLETQDETLQTHSFRILGQQVVTGPETLFQGSTADGLQAGMRLVVGGMRDAAGVVHATSIDADTFSGYLVTGAVSAVGSYSFQIGDLRIYDPYFAERRANGTLRVGAVLQVKGTPAFGTLLASSVHPLSVHGDHTVMRLEGYLEMTSAGPAVNGVPLSLDPETALDGGDAASLSGSRVSVTGRRMADGRLHAGALRVESSSRIRLDGGVDAVDLASGWIRVNGLNLHWGEDVSVVDRRDENRWIQPADIQVGDMVSVVARQTESGVRIKRLVRRPSHESRRLLRAPLADKAAYAHAIRAAEHWIGALEDAREVRLRGRDVSFQDLLSQVAEGESIELEWDEHGGLERIESGFAAGSTRTSRDDDDVDEDVEDVDEDVEDDEDD